MNQASDSRTSANLERLDKHSQSEPAGTLKSLLMRIQKRVSASNGTTQTRLQKQGTTNSDQLGWRAPFNPRRAARARQVGQDSRARLA